MPKSGRWKLRKNSTKTPEEDQVAQVQKRAKEYLISSQGDGTLRVPCPRCGLKVHERWLDNHFLHEHSSKRTPMPDPTSEKYAEDLLKLVKHLLKEEEEGEDA